MKTRLLDLQTGRLTYACRIFSLHQGITPLRKEVFSDLGCHYHLRHLDLFEPVKPTSSSLHQDVLAIDLSSLFAFSEDSALLPAWPSYENLFVKRCLVTAIHRSQRT